MKEVQSPDIGNGGNRSSVECSECFASDHHQVDGNVHDI